MVLSLQLASLQAYCYGGWSCHWKLLLDWTKSIIFHFFSYFRACFLILILFECISSGVSIMLRSIGGFYIDFQRLLMGENRSEGVLVMQFSCT
jgi:hypothetical protein